MENKLTKEEVLHVLDLARLDASEEEINEYQVELYKMIQEIDKIKELDDSDEIEIENGDILKNVPSKKGNFISVDVEVLKDE